jgi:hypothetical protein
LSIPNTESITVSHRDIDTPAVPHQDIDIPAVHDATFHSACRFVFVADYRSITECNEQPITYGDLNSHRHKSHANAWRQPDERSCSNGREYEDPDTEPIRRE